MSLILSGLAEPIICAPMAGGPSSPELVAAVSAAGGLGMLAAGYRTPDQVGAQIAAVRALTTAPFGVNVFLPTEGVVDPAELAAYAEKLPDSPQLAGPTADDDHFADKIELLCRKQVPLVSFAFGTPPAEVVEELHRAGTSVAVTVTDPADAEAAEAAGADAVIAQGVEAGGHRGGVSDLPGVGEYGLLTLLRLVSGRCGLPIVAAGGLCDGPSLAAALVAGAVAGQLGTAFLRCPEAGTNPVHRAAIGSARDTTLTRAFTGRPARALVNEFTTRYAEVPVPRHGYPAVHYLTAPMRAKAVVDGDPETLHLWAGQAHRLSTEEPAGDLVRRVGAAARQTLFSAAQRAYGW